MDLSKHLTRADQFSRKHLHLSLVSVFFWVCYCLLLLIHCVENTSLIYQNLPWIERMYTLRNGLYLLLLVKAGFLSTYQPGQLWSILGVLLSAVLCALFSGDLTLVEFAIVAIAAKDIPPKQLVRIFAIIKAIALVLTLALYATKILPTLYYENSTDVNNTFGFCHRNVLGANMYTLCLCWFYLRYRKLKLWDYLLWGVFSILTYLLADSRTTLLIMALTIGLFFVLRLWDKKLLTWRHIKKAVIGIFIGLFLISLICTVFYKRYNEFWEFVDKIFTKRLRFANQCLYRYGLSLFGSRIDFVSTLQAQLDADATRLILDNAYMRVLIYDGIVPCLLFLFFYIRSLSLACIRKHAPLLGCLLIMAVCGFSERFTLDVYYNFPLLIACMVLFRPTATQRNFHLPFEYAGQVLENIKTWFRVNYPRSPEDEP